MIEVLQNTTNTTSSSIPPIIERIIINTLPNDNDNEINNMTNLLIRGIFRNL